MGSEGGSHLQDLTRTIASHLDRHLVFPLLEFLKERKIYPEDDLLKAQLELLKNTGMVDFAMDIHTKNGQEVPEDLKQKRVTVLKKLKELSASSKPLITVVENIQLVAQLRKDENYNMPYLIEKHQVPANCLDLFYQHAKLLYDCGFYSPAALYLAHFRLLSDDPERCLSALWGKLAAEILSQNWNSASEDLKTLKDAIDNRDKKETTHTLQQRTWLIHWSLFIFFNHPNGRNGIIDMLFNDKYLNTIQMTCPYILRYLTTAVITNKRRRNVLNDLVRVIQQESNTYRDPITEFLEDLYVSFDFEGAQRKLRECETVLLHDFFLVSCRDEFIENARLFIFETYCRIHKRIDIGMLAEKLGMDQDAAERWIVNLIRNARLDAKIDSAHNHVIMGTKHPSIYQQVIDKTKTLSFRSSVLVTNLGNYLQEEGKN